MQLRTTIDDLVAARLRLSRFFSREELEQAQLFALRDALAYARANAPFYRTHLADLDTTDLSTLNDLEAIPFTTSEDIVCHDKEFLAVSQAEVSRVITLNTSGSTGKPKRLFFSTTDLAATSEFFQRGMASLIGDKDRVLVLLPFAQPDSTGDLLIRALRQAGIAAHGHWPPGNTEQTVGRLHEKKITSVVGLPHHLLILAEALGPGQVKTMLLCSDYAAPALRTRIESACGCTTFLHYGTTESGLGGAVECGCHNGCHIRESDLLIEIIDPQSLIKLGENQMGEIVLTTLSRQAMPLIRYRTGDLAAVSRAPCPCGGITARLIGIRGRLSGCLLQDGTQLCSQDLDDLFFTVDGLTDYRATIDSPAGIDRFSLQFTAAPGRRDLTETIRQLILSLPPICDIFAGGVLALGEIRQVTDFPPSHTVKRTIQDLRIEGASSCNIFSNTSSIL